MLVLSRKKIIFVIMLIMLIISCISMKEQVVAVVETSAEAVSEHVIVIDAGHGNPDGGAESKFGVAEQEINLKIALKLQELLEQSGYVVILTRSDENGIYDVEADTIKEKKVSDMKNRVNIGNTSEAEIFISIHLNKIEQEQYSGYQTFYQKNNELSKELALFIQDNLNFAIQRDNKREILPLTGKYIMDNMKIPTVTVECGFLSNLEESALLENDDYQMRLAWGIYLGIMDYFYE